MIYFILIVFGFAVVSEVFTLMETLNQRWQFVEYKIARTIRVIVFIIAYWGLASHFIQTLDCGL